jgi:hypothetical protein
MLPTQTFSFAASEHGNITVVGREKISCDSATARDTFLIVACVIPTPGRCFHFRVAFKTMISKTPGGKLLFCEFHLNGRQRVEEGQSLSSRQGNFCKVNGRMPRPQRYVFIKNIPS